MASREGNLEAPRREPIRWEAEEFTDPSSVDDELERVFDICHGCRRCVSLCNAFPTLFDLVDESDTLEVDGVAKEEYKEVVSQCYLCDLCAETKCPYLPPHEWAVDFPHLMLRAKARYLKEKKPTLRDRLITSTDPLFRFASKPAIAPVVNAASRSKPLRKMAELTFGVHADAPIPPFHSRSAQQRLRDGRVADDPDLNEMDAVPTPMEAPSPASDVSMSASPQPIADEARTRRSTARRRSAPTLDSSASLTRASGEMSASVGKYRHYVADQVAIFVTCYGDANSPQVVEDLVKVLTHNDVVVKVIEDTHCCGMPKFELGDIEAVKLRKEQNIPLFYEYAKEDYQIMSVVPSCTLMYRQEIPLLFPDDYEVKVVAKAFVDPFEYLVNGVKQDLISTDFEESLGRLTYHAACHQRVQNIGRKTREFLSLIPDTKVTMLDRCSGHGGTHAIKKETYESAMKIARPVTRKLKASNPDTFGSDCPIAGRLIAHGLDEELEVEHPISMVRRAYGLR